MKCATRPNLSPYGGAYSAGEDFTKKMSESLTKFESLRQNFIRRTPYGGNREKKIRADLEKARKIWKKVGERFKWWGSLP